MKKLICLTLLLCAFVQAWGHEWTDTSGRVWSFDIDGSTAINIQPTDSYRDIISGAVTIPATVYVNGTAYQVTSIASSAFRSCDQITSMTLPNGITTIGSSAFYGCPSIGSINIPASVTSIGGSAFSYNYSLQKVIVPDIAAWCNIRFSYNDSNPLTFAHHLYRDAYNEYTQLVIPQGVTTIGDYVFQDCTGLTSVNIPNSVTSIGEEAFSGCTNLANVSVPNSLEYVGDNAFTDTPFFNNQSGVVYLGKIAYRYAGNMPANTVININEGTESIAQSAFPYNPNLVSVNIPTTVKTIGERAFQSCDGLTEVFIPEGVMSIGDFAFMRSEGIQSVTLPSTLTNINRSVFKNCTSLKRIDIPNGVESIGTTAFDGCESLTNISIPATVTTISDYAFDDCDAVTTVYNFSTEPQTITSGVFSCYQSATLFVPFSSLSAYQNADNWKKFHNIVGILRGDVNGDGAVDITDVVCLVDHTLNKAVPFFVEPAADLNADGEINIEDVVCLVNLLLGKEM